MRRFLLYLGYCGTNFRGVQKQPCEEFSDKLTSIQGYVDEGLRTLQSAYVPRSYFSSRTDKGVHALCNTAHVDLCRKDGSSFYCPDYITKKLNTYFDKNLVDIRIQKTLAVPFGFHARHNAEGRSYLYRLAVLKSRQSQDFHPLSSLPVVELNRTHIVSLPFDIAAFTSGCQLFQGDHNFGTFMAAPSKSTPAINSNRSIDSITVSEGRPLLDPVYDPLYENIQLYDINVSARSFLYKQVRRIVGALIAAAQGRISLDCIQWMLDNPAPQNWNSRAIPAPAKGLYLLQVNYSAEVFEESFYLDKCHETQLNVEHGQTRMV